MSLATNTAFVLLLSLTEFAKYLGVSDPLQYASIAFAMNNLVNLIGNVTSVFTTLSWPPAPHWILLLPYGHPNETACVRSVG